MGRLLAVASAFVLMSSLVSAQEHPHPSATPTPAPHATPTPAPSASPSPAGMEGMDHAGMDMGQPRVAGPAMGEEHAMRGFFGPYSMSREASGTSWQPDSSPMEGIHGMRGRWMYMVHGYADLVFDHQGGPRGADDTYLPTMGMFMAQRPVGGGTLGARAMLSTDPGTVGKRGYPLLLQTGESVGGRPLIDRQHPHDLFMELAVTYSRPLRGDRGSVFLYAGLPGEPALGAPTYMHRFSGTDAPEAPISHHWMDSTHITYGVLTGGVTWGGLKVDASAFRGREPDENRWDIERPKLDSYSGRVQYTVGPDWALQASVGHLKSPEALEPAVDQWRSTASVTYNRPRPGGDWQTTLAWGRNDRTDQDPQDSFLLESAVRKGRHTVFARGERVAKDELFETEPLARTVFDVHRLSLGYVFDVLRTGGVASGVGGLVSVIGIPSTLTPAYGGHPVSFMVFARAQIR